MAAGGHGMGLNGALIMIFSLCALAGAVAVVLTRNTVHAALWFVSHLLCLAALYALLDAPLLGVLQVMVYAGAVVVLFLFATMILDMREQERDTLFSTRGQALGAVLLAAVLLGSLASLFGHDTAAALAAPDLSAPSVGVDNIARVARLLFRDQALVFEAVGLLLLSAVVAVMVMAKRKLEG